jgi:hypothetical protein
MDQSITIFPCSGIIFLCQPSTAGYELMHRSNRTGIDEAYLSATKTNRLDTGLKKKRGQPPGTTIKLRGVIKFRRVGASLMDCPPSQLRDKCASP